MNTGFQGLGQGLKVLRSKKASRLFGPILPRRRKARGWMEEGLPRRVKPKGMGELGRVRKGFWKRFC